MEYHPSKTYIKASIIPREELQNIPNDIAIPFFIEYGSLYPYILYIFKRVNNEFVFIEKDEVEFLFQTFFHKDTSLINHHSIFYEIQNTNTNIPFDLSNTLYDDNTLLWFATSYEIYTTKKIFNIPFSSQVNDFFLDNPSLEKIYWDHKVQPSPIIAYSQNSILRKTIFQSTFGADFSRTPPHFTLYKNINNPDLSTVRYALFRPYDESKNGEELYFVRHIQHTPICYIATFPTIYENENDDIETV
jgi:hypothetical protein